MEVWELGRAWVRFRMLWSSLIAAPSAPNLNGLLSLTLTGMSVSSQSALTKPQVFPLKSSNAMELRGEPASSKPIKHCPLIELSPQRGNFASEMKLFSGSEATSKAASFTSVCKY